MRRVPHTRLPVPAVMRCLYQNPYRHIIRRRNWKTACLSAGVRGLMLLSVHLLSSGLSAAEVMAVEVVYRALTAGFFSAAIQAFRCVHPFWAAASVTMVMIPCMADAAQIAVHWIAGTRNLGATVAASLVFTGLSVLFELYAMRCGILVVGSSSKPLLQDLQQVPRLFFSLAVACLYYPGALARQIQKIWMAPPKAPQF